MQKNGLLQWLRTRLGRLSQTQFAPPEEEILPEAGRRVNCVQLLTACKPWLEALSPEPPEGWLLFCYQELAHGLFPDEHRPAVSAKTKLACGVYVETLRYAIAHEDCPFDPLTDIDGATGPEIAESHIAEEYRRFQQAVADAHFVELMRIGREIMPFDPASHTIGVHHIATDTARRAKQAGVPVDVALVSAASLSHDIGKFGCRGRDAQRIPYLHYYFTWQWLERHQLPTIANIAANHSTWDLEFENLPGESLMLIYADFRVRGLRDEGGRERVKVYSLAEAYDLIFSKLYNMTPEKAHRYQMVYAKLHDFEEYLRSIGVFYEPVARPSRWPAALLPTEEIPRELCNLTFSNNIRLMRHITLDASFEQLLEQARNEKTLYSIRNYLHLYAEYHTYLTAAQKGKLLAFLYELLMHHDGDVRRRAGRIMGQILSNSGPKYRKELPSGMPEGVSAPNLLSFLKESLKVWESYVDQCLHPDLKIAPKHAQRIANSLKVVAGSVFENLSEDKWPEYLEVLLVPVRRWEPADRFTLMDTLCHLPQAAFDASRAREVTARVGQTMFTAPEHEKIMALRLLGRFAQLGDEDLTVEIRQLADRLDAAGSRSVAFERSRLLGFDACGEISAHDLQHLYLSNMETAVHWMVKLSHVDMLCEHALANPEHTFHTAMHLSNLICVSEHMPVRLRAEERLVELTANLPAHQKNELVINLLLELETVRDEISRFLPRHLGQMLCQLPKAEFLESLQMLAEQIHSDNPRAATAAVSTLGYLLTAMQGRSEPLAHRVLGLLLTAVAHYEPEIYQGALSTICRGVFDERSLPLPIRRQYFQLICKKLLTLLEEAQPGQLNFFTQAAALNHLYRFMVQCRVELPAQPMEPERPAAFFPGTFDPFSTGHRQIVEEVCRLGCQVYLAIDEFSWSKQTLPKLLRRQIASISVADCLNVYLFPDNIPINIAMAADLQKLYTLIPSDQVSLAVGSDVVRNASAYAEGGAAAEFDHILFCREDMTPSALLELQKKVRGRLKVLKLPQFYDEVSSSRIREYVDKNLDISMLVDPIVQNLIYQRGYYLRSPQYKEVLAPHKLYYTTAQSLLPEIPLSCDGWERTASVTLRSRDDGQLWGWACGHGLLTSQLYEIIGDYEVASLVRKQVSGSILMVAGVEAKHPGRNVVRMLLNELLSRAQEHDYTYAMCRAKPESDLAATLMELGFRPSAHCPGLWIVDMRSPMVLIQDTLQNLKAPHRDDPEVIAVVEQARSRLRLAYARMFPGNLILSFNTELLNHALRDRVQRCNQVEQLPQEGRTLGKKMCVPFGKILANELVPHTVTKRLEAEKEFTPDLRNFTIREYAGYSVLPVQMRTIKSFRRPVILVDDLLHNGYRIARLDPLLKQEQVDVERIIVGVMSGKGQDQMKAQGRVAECEYFVPNLRYWQTESLLYPFIGGDGVATHRRTEMLPAVNLVLPYQYPQFFSDVAYQDIYRLSVTVLENALSLLRVLERKHLEKFGKSLTLRRLGEAIVRPRLPDRGGHLRYDLNIPASIYVHDDLNALQRSHRREENE